MYVGTITIGYPPAERTPTLQELIDDDLNFKVWSALMKTTLKDQGLWDVVENGIPPDPSKNPETLKFEVLCRWREFVRKDMKALEILQSSLPDSVFRKTLSATSAKELWEMLEQVPEHVSLATCFDEWTCDEDIWMIHTNTTTNHMTPHERFFTNLDRTRRARVKFNDGTILMAQGTGDVRILTVRGLKLTIKNVLFVPGIVTNVLSVGQLERSGDYDVDMGRYRECNIWDRATGTLLAYSTWDIKRGFFLLLNAVRRIR